MSTPNIILLATFGVLCMTVVPGTVLGDSLVAQPARCHYYCVYRHTAYCCDDGSLPRPESHGINDGRCPLLSEQTCKNNTVMLHMKAQKVSKTADGDTYLGELGEEAIPCASDGYCGADFKCCESACARRHICLRALHPRKWKPNSSEKQRSKH